MGNFTFTVRAKRWAKFLVNYVGEKVRGLDFSMVYVGDIQRNTAEYHGYSMTDADDLKRMLQSVPIDPSKAAFLDVGCGKGMCMKCAVEIGYKKVAGLDLDQDLLDIARKNMKKLKMDVDCLYANAVEFENYADYDVFYFYNPFGKRIFEKTVQKILESQGQRNRDIWVVYYYPASGEVFEKAGFKLHAVVQDTTRDTYTNCYLYPKKD